MDWLKILLVSGAAQGALMTGALLRSKYNKNLANRYLAIWLLLISLAMLGRVIAESDWVVRIPNLLAFPDAIIFLFGPLLYFYCRHLIFAEIPREGNKWPHFIPALIYSGIELSFVLSGENYFAAMHPGGLYYWHAFVEGSALIQNVLYFLATIKLMRVYRRQRCENLGSAALGYLRPIILSISIILLLWLYAYVSWVFFIPQWLTWVSYLSIWLMLVSITYLLSYFAIYQPEAFRKRLLEKRSLKNGADLDIAAWHSRIPQYMADKKPFLDAKLSLHQLAEQLTISPHTLSRIINTGYEKNFSDFVNHYRVEEFKRLLKETDATNWTLLAIAFEAGFNSKTTFNTVFKKTTGMTPDAYRKQIVSMQ